MDVFDRGIEPNTILQDRSSQRSHVILAREGLLGRRRRVLDREARVERRLAIEERFVSVPVIGPAFGGDYHRAGCGAARVRIFLGRPHRKFLHGIRRIILQESPNVVVGVVASIDRKLIVQPRAASRGYCGDARFGGVAGLHWFRAWREVGDIGKAARGQRQRLQVLACNDALVNIASQVDRLLRDR